MLRAQSLFVCAGDHAPPCQPDGAAAPSARNASGEGNRNSRGRQAALGDSGGTARLFRTRGAYRVARIYCVLVPLRHRMNRLRKRPRLCSPSFLFFCLCVSDCFAARRLVFVSARVSSLMSSGNWVTREVSTAAGFLSVPGEWIKKKCARGGERVRPAQLARRN